MYIQLLLILSIAFGSKSFADSTENMNFYAQGQEVFEAYTNVLAGKTLVSDNGSVLQFGAANNCTVDRVCIPYKQTFVNGRVAAGYEIVTSVESSAVMEQFIYGIMARKYFATLEGPMKVLRIKPIDSDTSDFISRDCIFSKSEQKTICYVKVKFMNDVIITAYREINQ